MLDTLLLVASLSHPPIERPLVPVVLNTKPVSIEVKSVNRPESLTTCHESSYGSCWSE